MLPGAPAPAEDQANPPSEESEDLETIEIHATPLPDVVELPSSAVTVINVTDLGAGDVTTTMLARGAPSARVREFGGPGQRVTVGLRGAAAHQTQVQLDGVPLPDPTGAGVDLSALPVDFVERMEVLRGAASVQAGSGALGGVVNLVTRSDRRDGFFGRLSAGSYGTWRAAAGTAAHEGPANFLVMASGLSSAGDFTYPDDNGTPVNPFDDREERRDNNDALQGGWLVKVATGLPGGARLHLTHQLTAQDRGVAGLLGFTADRAREEAWSGLVDLRARIPLEESSLEAGANLLMTGRHFRDPAGELTGVPLDTEQEGLDLEVHAGGIAALGERHLLRGRVRLRSSTLRDPGFGDPSREEALLGASAEWSFFSGRWKIVPGLGLGYFSDAGVQWAPALGTLIGLTEDVIVRANVARAYRVPNFNELYLQGGYAVGNPDLRPEAAWSADLGVEWARPGGFRAVLTGFYVRYADLIVFEPTANFRYRPLNVGAADLGGLEVELDVTPLRWLTATGHYTLLLTADRSGLPNREDNELPGRPRHTAGLRVRVRQGRLLAEVDAYYVSGNFANQANTKSLADRLLVGAGVGVDAGAGLTVMLQGKNLLDDQVQDVRGLPLQGISFYLTVGFTRKDES